MDYKLEQLATALQAAVRDEVSAKHKYEACTAMCETARSVHEHSRTASVESRQALMDYLLEGIIPAE